VGGLAPLILAGLAALALASPTSAQGTCELTVSSTSDPRTFRIEAQGFAADESIDFELIFGGETLFSFSDHADADGNYEDVLKADPGDPQGEYTLTATADSCAAEATFQFELPDTAAAEPVTQGSAGSLYAIVVLAAGAAAFVLMLRRRVEGASH
jgi:hypothetical protein